MKKDSGFIKITNADAANPLTIGDKFKVAWDGNIIA
jgi:hypothetical protein